MANALTRNHVVEFMTALPSRLRIVDAERAEQVQMNGKIRSRTLATLDVQHMARLWHARLKFIACHST